MDWKKGYAQELSYVLTINTIDGQIKPFYLSAFSYISINLLGYFSVCYVVFMIALFVSLSASLLLSVSASFLSISSIVLILDGYLEHVAHR